MNPSIHNTSIHSLRSVYHYTRGCSVSVADLSDLILSLPTFATALIDGRPLENHQFEDRLINAGIRPCLQVWVSCCGNRQTGSARSGSRDVLFSTMVSLDLVVDAVLL